MRWKRRMVPVVAMALVGSLAFLAPGGWVAAQVPQAGDRIQERGIPSPLADGTRRKNRGREHR